MVQDSHSGDGDMPPELQSRAHSVPPPGPPQNQPGSSSLPSSQPPSQQFTPLFVSQETIDQLSKSKDEPSKLPPMVPGHYANTFSFCEFLSFLSSLRTVLSIFLPALGLGLDRGGC